MPWRESGFNPVKQRNGPS